jgi:7,8-dihydropterin-6-yl-methyl-4-(beta-D-ribofuranosyl)aminobenzene 5'-phosphate synthase
MKITVLVDNNTLTDEHFYGEPGVCYWLEVHDKKILFDTGFSDLLVKNAKKLKINLRETNFIILSHGHNDHATGLKYFPFSSKRIKVVVHPDCFNPKYFGKEYIGSPVSEKQVREKYTLIKSKKPYFIDKNTVFLGEIPIKYQFEKRKPIGTTKKNGKIIGDLLLDDTAIVIKTNKGLIIITGCSHSGICNIVNYSKKVLEEKRVRAVVGGFHLWKIPQTKLEKTITTLKKEGVEKVYPAHCVELKSKVALWNNFPTGEIFVSKTVTLPRQLRQVGSEFM